MNLPASDALTSITIPCLNQLEFTRVCLSALVRHTRARWELIVIDNGSTDGTGTYLAGVQDAVPVPVTVVSNARNLGFPAAINQGLKERGGITWSCSITTPWSPTPGLISLLPWRRWSGKEPRKTRKTRKGKVEEEIERG